MAGSAERALSKLPDKAAAAVIEFILGPLLDAPRRVGKPLRGDQAGRWAARRGPYRVIYELDVTEHAVRLLHLDHRANVYRPR